MPPSNVIRANVLGVGVSAVDMPNALRLSVERLRQRQKGYICVTGAHGIIEAQRDPRLLQILNSAFLCVPDGMPTAWVGRLQGHHGMRRVYGPDFMIELCRLSVESGYRHFLYGGGTGVVEKLKRSLEKQIAGIQIAGICTPPFRPMTAAEEQALLEQVTALRPDIFWVGLSTPKQERFMAAMLERLDTCLMVGVGAAFDLHAGLRADAPALIKSCGLQWLHRLLQEPERLWRRYAEIVPRFLWDSALQFTGVKKFRLNS